MLFQEFMPELKKEIGKEISEKVEKAVNDNLRTMKNKLEGCREDSRHAVIEVCEKHLKAFKDEGSLWQVDTHNYLDDCNLALRRDM